MLDIVIGPERAGSVGGSSETSSCTGKEMHRAPAEDVVQLRPGMRVQLQNMRNIAHNGKKCVVLEYVPHADNWRVELETAVAVRVTAANCIPLDVSPKAEKSPPSATASAASVESCDPIPPPAAAETNEQPPSCLQPTDGFLDRRTTLAAQRFERVHERIAKEFAAKPNPVQVSVHIEDQVETLNFDINAKWDKGRKAMFAKTYTKLYAFHRASATFAPHRYKDSQRKLRIVISEAGTQVVNNISDADNES